MNESTQPHNAASNDAASNDSVGYSRRQVLRTGGLVITFGAVAAACGDRSGPTDAGRLGISPPPATLPEVTVDDQVIMRTSQSLAYTTLAVHAAAVDAGVLNDKESALVARIVEDDQRHADTFGELISAAGGEPWTCANPFMVDRIVNPILEAIETSDDAHRDFLNTANTFESWAGASYQAMVTLVKDGAVRTQMQTLAGEALRHASVLARVINPDEAFASTFFGDPIAKDADGFWPVWAIPSVFGRVAGIDLVVGDVNDEGTRFSIQLQTPAANSFVYPHQSC